MKRSYPEETRCLFRVRCSHVQQVRLVIERRPGVSQIFPLEPRGEDMWETVLDLEPGEYHYCYHAYNGRTLTYLTPPDAPLDGLKAVLRLGESEPIELGRTAPACLAFVPNEEEEDESEPDAHNPLMARV